MFLRNIRNLVLVMAPVMLFVFVYSHYFQKPKGDSVVHVGVGDPAMASARAEGRATLPTFLEHLKNPATDESHFIIKFRLDRKQVLGPMQQGMAQPGDEPDEFIWAKNPNLMSGGTLVSGFIDDTPRSKGFYRGQPVMVPTDDIIDWAYRKDGKVQGAYTTKVLLSKLPSGEAAQARAAMGWD
jgi:uncharacterized protein YegJ (DUF2314 family)